MSEISYTNADRVRICRLCEGEIHRTNWAVTFEKVHVSPKWVDLHFHEGCLHRAMDDARSRFASKMTEGMKRSGIPLCYQEATRQVRLTS